MVNHFWQSVDVILEDVSVIDVFCEWNTYLMLNYQLRDYHLSVFQKLRSPTPVTRLKVEPNMTDPISLNEKETVALRPVKWVTSWFFLFGVHPYQPTLDFAFFILESKNEQLIAKRI